VSATSNGAPVVCAMMPATSARLARSRNTLCLPNQESRADHPPESGIGVARGQALAARRKQVAKSAR
jgi:hypothetical protein